MPLWEAIEYDIIDSFSYKCHIFRSVRKIRKCGKYFLIDTTEYHMVWGIDCLLAYMLHDTIHKNPPNEKSYEYSKHDSDWEDKYISIHGVK